MVFSPSRSLRKRDATTIGAAGGRSAPSTWARAAKRGPEQRRRRARREPRIGRALERVQRLHQRRHRVHRLGANLGIERFGRRSFDAERPRLAPILEQRQNVATFGIARRVGEEVGEIVLREKAIADERGRFGGDADGRRRDRRLARRDHVRETDGQLAGARIRRRFDRVFDERQLLRPGGAVSVGVPRPEPVERHRIDDVGVAAAQPAQQCPHDACTKRWVCFEARVVQRLIDEPEGAAESETQTLEIADADGERVAASATRARVSRQHDGRVEVRRRPRELRDRVGVDCRPVVRSAEAEGDGEQKDRDEEGNAADYIHRCFVPVAGDRVAEPLGPPSMLVPCNTMR